MKKWIAANLPPPSLYLKWRRVYARWSMTLVFMLAFTVVTRRRPVESYVSMYLMCLERFRFSYPPASYWSMLETICYGFHSWIERRSLYWWCFGLVKLSPKMMKSWNTNERKLYILLPGILGKLNLNEFLKEPLNIHWFCLLVPPAACTSCNVVCLFFFFFFLFQADHWDSPSFQHQVWLILFFASLSSSCPDLIAAGGLFSAPFMAQITVSNDQ